MGLDLGADFVAGERARAADVNDKLDIIKAALNTQNPGELIVADADDEPRPVALSGDATLAASGALTIAALAVTSGKIANEAVTSSKLGLDILDLVSSADSNITGITDTDYKDLTGASGSGVTGGTWLLIPTFRFYNHNAGAASVVHKGVVRVNGSVALTVQEKFSHADGDYRNASVADVVSIANGATVKLSAVAVQLAGTRQCLSGSRLLGVRLGI